MGKRITIVSWLSAVLILRKVIVLELVDGLAFLGTVLMPLFKERILLSRLRKVSPNAQKTFDHIRMIKGTTCEADGRTFQPGGLYYPNRYAKEHSCQSTR